MNSLGSEISSEFQSIINDIETNEGINSAVLISSKPGCFVAGADINMIEKCKSIDEVIAISRNGQHMFQRIENSKKPIVAAIDGSCLGGGFELALSCHYRIATKTKKTVFGLPEVMLGLLPAAGGTVRLPKLASIPTALDLELTGKTVKADKAKKLGMVDLIVSPLGPGLKPSEENTNEYLEKVAVQIAKDISSGKLKVSFSIYFIVSKFRNLIYL